MDATLRFLVFLALIASAFTPVYAQQRDPAAVLLGKLTPQEKVGQLFLVNFDGTNVGPTSQIYDLIVNYHVGGVVLTAENDNFVAENTPRAAYDLISSLQAVETETSANPTSPTFPHTYIPLFVGISQEGGGYPNDQILNGLTPIPDQMALGATWDRQLTQDLGTVMGRELAALGFNLYLGLSLDVLTLPDPAVNADLNTRVFGGDPYWVRELARAYLTGLHDGSGGRMAVIVKHFPGRGGSDRPSAQEVATIRRSLEELKSVELAPFFGVTGDALDAGSTADGLLVSHIRYQGFQGNIRATTRPISFDPQALGQVLNLPQLANWRGNGGLIVSDDLGTQAVRRFYDPDMRSFAGRLVARDAFLAGNDLMYMGNITSSDKQDTYTTVIRTLEFFTQKYKEDPAFASRVDESVRRILSLKYRLYGTFEQPALQPPVDELNTLGVSNEKVFAVARQAATLVNPSLADLPTVLPTPPNTLDYIVFLTDSRVTRQCSTCPDLPVLGRTAFQAAVQKLYGSSSGALIVNSHLSSYSFDDLNLLLDDRLPAPDLPNDLGRATWVVISTLDLPEGSQQMTTLQRFLTEKQSLLSSKKVILFSFSAPYYLDATNISKLTAFYSLYGDSEPFVDVAARLLFQEISPAGALPVSVPSVGYDLILATSPDPDQVIKLSLDASTSATPEADGTATAEPTAVPLFRVGDTISVRTGLILDHNQRPVPDGTVVRFVLSRSADGLSQQVEAFTSQGVALASFRLEQDGLIEIRATSEPAHVSDTIQLNVNNEGSQPIIITPTVEATPVPTPVPPTPAPEPTQQAGISTVVNGYPNFLGWFLVVLVLVAGAGLVFWLGSQIVDLRWAIRWALLVFLGGLLAYNYLVLGFPGGDRWLDGRGLPAFLQAVLIGQGIGVALGWFWRLSAESSNETQEQ